MYKKLLLQQLLLLLTLGFLLGGCTKDDDYFREPPIVDPVEEAGPYSNGFFIITEGSYGQTAGTVNFYAYGADTIVTRAYEKANPGKITANASLASTLQFATLYNQKLYLASKMNGPIIRLDASTLKEEARYNQESSNWRGLIGVKEDQGLVSAADGVYSINLNTLGVQYKLTSVSAVNTGDMLKEGNYVYLLQSNGAKIIDAANYSFVKGFTNINRGFARTPNGKVWASTGTRLISIDKNLDTTGITLPVSIGSFGLDAPTRLTASTKEDAVFYHSGAAIYKYVEGNAASLNQPFITISESPFMVYGAVRYDRNKDYLVVNGIKGYGGLAGANFLLIYNASTGALVKKITYGNDGSVVDFNHIYFPELAVFY
ncbi:DUF5074 domain-containing protein [Niabella beijingensis]|uniref:DUF5074 domain-containing protein n=1 Tax=Niabella beijingensis TaxID=2872700 RepID=UPI001CBF9718|nr:DUF5074 domain-containing protein [Niabella beijingensis]MBZ4189196.1 DUF5074 domain-containing protein [Niabella beijingensis]